MSDEPDAKSGGFALHTNDIGDVLGCRRCPPCELDPMLVIVENAPRPAGAEHAALMVTLDPWRKFKDSCHSLRPLCRYGEHLCLYEERK